MLDIQLVDTTVSADSNLQHVLYVFEGYRSMMLNHPFEPVSEYSPGAARDVSFRAGVKLAMKDLVKR